MRFKYYIEYASDVALIPSAIFPSRELHRHAVDRSKFGETRWRKQAHVLERRV